MLESETDRILRTIRDHTLDRKSSVTLKEILAADIPYAVKLFFRTDVELALRRELQEFRERSRFSFDHPEVQSLQRQMNSIAILHYAFTAKEFDKRLGDVVHLVANYLIRPQWTIGGVLFEKDDVLTTRGLLSMLKYFGAYDYLRDIIIRYIRERNVTSFSKRDFAHFLWKADGAYVSRKTGEELSRVLVPLYEFFEYPFRSNSVRIPAQALIKFFEDKGLSSVTARLEGELQHAPAEYSQSELAQLLEDVRGAGGAFSVDRPEPEPEVAAQADEHAAPQPAPVQMPEALPRAAEELPPSPPTNGETAPAVAKGAPLADFASSLDDGERKRFLKKLFHQDEPAFQTALSQMSAIASWKDASRFIDEIFIQNDINPYSSEAKRFIDIVYQKFYPPR